MEAVKTAKQMMMLVAMLLVSFVATQAQDARLQFDQLDKLAPKADNVVEVTLDKNLLQVAA